MPDVDEAVRELTKACTTVFYNEDDASKRAAIEYFYTISDENRPVILKGRTNSQVETFLKRLYPDLSNAISKHFGYDVVFIKEGSRNNKDGSDLIATIRYDDHTEDKEIELKFGKETLKAPGLETIDKIFVVDTEKNFFEKVFADVKKNQREFALRNKGKVDLLVANLAKQLAPIIEKCKELYQKGHLHINSYELFNQLSVTGSVKSGEPLIIPTKFKIRWKSIKVSEKLDLTGEWKITEINSPIGNGARIVFFVSNGKVEVKFLLNWKNSLFYDGYKYPSKVGINTYSFNIWAWRKE